MMHGQKNVKQNQCSAGIKLQYLMYFKHGLCVGVE